jgi:peptidoglycan/xylan/chitin deacetylase (PgdA/CDA1 family)
VGNHSFYHARMPLLSTDGFRTDVLDAQRAITSIVGVDPRPWFRCPFGEGHDDERILADLSDLGYRNIYWTVQLEDWEPWRAGDAIASDLLEGVQGHDWSVVLLHTWPEGTGDAIPKVLEAFADRDVELVTVAETSRRPHSGAARKED